MLSILLSFYLALPIEKADHALYLSVLEIDKQEMKVKVFTDNLEDAIRSDANSIEEYFQKMINLKVNDQVVSFSLKQVKEEGDSHWITFDLQSPSDWRSFHLEAGYFMELFPDQINVVKIKGDKPQFFRLTKLQSSCSYSK